MIYNSYHLEQKSVYNFDDFIDNLTTSDICLKINDSLSGKDEIQPYLGFLKFGSDQ